MVGGLLWLSLIISQCTITWPDPAVLWDAFKCEMFDAAQESIGVAPRARQNSISQEIREATMACHTAELASDWVNIDFWCADIGYYWATRNNLSPSLVGRRPFLCKWPSPWRPSPEKAEFEAFHTGNAVHSMDGNIILDPVGVRARWAVHFKHLPQVEPPTLKLAVDDVAIPAPGPPISGEPPTLTEGWKGIWTAATYESGTIPDLLKEMIIPFWEGKGIVCNATVIEALHGIVYQERFFWDVSEAIYWGTSDPSNPESFLANIQFTLPLQFASLLSAVECSGAGCLQPISISRDLLTRCIVNYSVTYRDTEESDY